MQIQNESLEIKSLITDDLESSSHNNSGEEDLKEQSE